ncbi:MAG: hypothetical protein HZA72_02470 [Candidatus Omnitrophica bacterium]|nr:hypothetical protein [Candidatus Omnitrophota bacterium]
MNKFVISIAVIGLALLAISFMPLRAQDTWVARGQDAKNSELRAAILSKDALYIATKAALYRAKDIKERWESVFSLPQGGNNEIRCLAGRGKAIFIGTKRGLFRSEDYGQSWKNVFKTILPDKNSINYIEFSRNASAKVLIATEKGIFISDDLGDSWQEISGVLKNTSVKCLALNKESMYAGTGSGLYVRRAGAEDWERILIRNLAEKNETEEGPEFSEDEAEKDMSIRSISINDKRVYIAYDKDIVYSDDGGKSWNDFTNSGLKGSINYILISPKNKKIYCAADKGVFEFNEEKSRWLELYKGMMKNAGVNRVIFASEDEKALLAVTDNGLYSFESGDYMMDKYPDIDKSIKTLKAAFDGEPAFKELQQAAIRYAEVSPEKIKKWRAGAQARALLPKVSFGFDKNRSDNYEIYTSATKEYIFTGPDDISDGWNVSLSWELGDFIWSDDQTNIDVRSKLMVQLRNDILDDLRRTYYERKRLQFELMSNPPKDMNLKFEKELRLKE